MKILLPVDGSHYTKRMPSYIAAHDELLGPEHDYIALTAVAPLPPHASRMVQRNVRDDYYREQADAVLQPVQAFAEQAGWKIRVAHVPAHAADAIAAIADAEAVDLIVMGTHGHTSLANVILGSVVNGVLARCKRPLLLIP